MASSINVRLPGELQTFVKAQTDGVGVYDSTSEYIRDLIRRDYERAEEQKWQRLESLLRPGLEADEDSFETVSRDEVITAAKARGGAWGLGFHRWPTGRYRISGYIPKRHGAKNRPRST